MKTLIVRVIRRATRRRVALTLSAATVLALLLAAAPALAGDVYSNIGPAPQVTGGGIFGRYPIGNYQLDQYFPAISVGLTSGVDASGVVPMIAYFFAQALWGITSLLAYGVITLFGFAFNLDLVNGNGSPGSGALTPVSSAIHNIYASTFGAPWLVVAIVCAGCWAMWKALVQRRYTETAGALAVSLLYCVLAIGIVTQPERTIAPASKLSNQISTALLSLTNQGSISNEQQAKSAASDQLFNLLVLNPWTALEFGGIEHCTTGPNSTHSVAVRPLSTSPARDSQLAAQLENATEVQAQGKTCVNNREKYAPHFLTYSFQSKARNSEHEALEEGNSGDLPSSDPGKSNGTYRLGKADEPAAEAMGKGGQYQRMLLSIVILAGEIGAFLLLGALALGVILAQILLLTLLCFAPVALVLAVFPGRGHNFFRSWLGKLAGYLARKVIYSLILAIVLAVCQAVGDATSNLGWLLAFVLQAAFLWAVFIQRDRLTKDLLAATAGPDAAQDHQGRLQNLYYATRLTQMARRRKQPKPPPKEDPPKIDIFFDGSFSPNPDRNEEATVATPSSPAPRGTDVPEPGDEYDEPIAGSEGGPLPVSDDDEFDPDEEPA
jgi:TrbL/VirB6 plasmid conjugal transfer protein